MGERTDRAGACIEIISEDHAFFAELYVRAVLDRGLIVQCTGPSLSKAGKACPVDLETGEAWTGRRSLKTSHFDLKWNVGKKGFDIIRREDQQIVGKAENFPTREQAVEWIEKTTRG
jgi:hypothetical protein